MADVAHLSLVLPGGGYAPLGPALRVPALTIQEVGAEVKTVPYPEQRPRGLGERASKPFNASVAHSIAELLGDAAWDRVTFIAKSRGSMVLAALDAAIVNCDDVRAVWVTPIFGLEYVRRGAIAKSWRSLVVAGGSDSYHDPAGHLEVVDHTNARSLIIAGADHLLEVPGDVQATLEGWHRLATAVLEFARED